MSIRKNDWRPLAIIGILFFVFGFVTWLSSVLIPYLQIACELGNFESYLVAFAFYISYFVMAVPSGWLLKKTGFKKGMSIGLLVVAIGSLVFIPAALTRTYNIFLLGLFIQGIGLALLQTASNPYVTILGPHESAAKRISIMGICNGVAGIMAPIILGAIVLSDADALTRQVALMDAAEKNMALNELAMKVITPYLAITAVLVLLAAGTQLSNLPEINEEEQDKGQYAAKTNKTSIFQFPHLLIGAGVLFLYTGVEVIAGNTIISYGAYLGIPLSTAKFFTSLTLTGMLVGYIIGIICIPRYISQQQALKISAISGIVFAATAMLTGGAVSVLFVALLGLSNSLMWPSIWPLAIADLGRFTKTGSSLLVMAISGAAVLPLLYGWFADTLNSQVAYGVVIPCYLAIYYYAVRGHRIRKR